ncbi:26S proteasome regulatory subunit, partial [Coemansia sp. BCRC 34490]
MDVDNPAHNYLQRLQNEAPSGLAQYFLEFEDLYERKLWHQLTKKVEEFINIPEAAPYRIGLYNEFVKDWQKHMNKVKLVLFSLAAARQFDDVSEAAEFMAKIAEGVSSTTPETSQQEEAYVLALLESAHFKLQLNDLDAT